MRAHACALQAVYHIQPLERLRRKAVELLAVGVHLCCVHADVSTPAVTPDSASKPLAQLCLETEVAIEETPLSLARLEVMKDMTGSSQPLLHQCLKTLHTGVHIHREAGPIWVTGSWIALVTGSDVWLLLLAKQSICKFTPRLAAGQVPRSAGAQARAGPGAARLADDEEAIQRAGLRRRLEEDRVLLGQRLLAGQAALRVLLPPLLQPLRHLLLLPRQVAVIEGHLRAARAPLGRAPLTLQLPGPDARRLPRLITAFVWAFSDTSAFRSQPRPQHWVGQK